MSADHRTFNVYVSYDGDWYVEHVTCGTHFPIVTLAVWTTLPMVTLNTAVETHRCPATSRDGAPRGDHTRQGPTGPQNENPTVT